MKKFAAIAVLTGLAASAFAQNAPVNQIDLGLGYYGTDATGVYKDSQNKVTLGQTAKYDPSLNWSGKYTYTYKLDDANILKFALADDGWYGFYDGKSGTALGSGQNAGKITPSVQWSGFGTDVVLSAPIYYLNPADLNGLNELLYAYKETNYLPIIKSPKTGGKYPLEDNSVITTTSLSVFYKYSFDKTTWVSGGVAGQLAINPVPVLITFLPKVSGGVSGFQLDVQFDDYNSPGNKNAAASGPASAADLQKGYADLYLEPKLTYDFGFPGWLPNFKAYFQSRIGLLTTNPTYSGDNLASGKDQAFHDVYVQPGVNYAYTVAGVGTFGIDASWRFNKLTSVASYKSDGKTITGTDASTTKDVPAYSELRLALSYSTKF